MRGGGIFAFDIRTTRGFYEWNNITFEESDDGQVAKNGIYDGGGSARQRVIGSNQVTPDGHRRFEQTVDDTVYPVAWVESRLLEIGRRQVRAVSIETLEDPSLTRKVMNGS